MPFRVLSHSQILPTSLLFSRQICFRQSWLNFVPGKGSAVQKNSYKAKFYLSPTSNQPTPEIGPLCMFVNKFNGTPCLRDCHIHEVCIYRLLDWGKLKQDWPLSIAPGWGPEVSPPVTLKPKLKSLPIPSSVEHLNEYVEAFVCFVCLFSCWAYLRRGTPCWNIHPQAWYTPFLKTLTAKQSWYRRGCGYRSSIFDFLKL